MDLFICDGDMNVQYIVDHYTSMIWTERYSECGDFEVQMPYDRELYLFLTENAGLETDRFLKIRESDVIMVIEEVSVLTDRDEGDHMEIKGRSLESILDRRIIYGQCELNTVFEEGITTLLNQNGINPENPMRKIPGLRYESSGDTRIATQTIETQFYCDNLYEAIASLCAEKHIGFRLRKEGENLTFKLFMGEDRSLGQEDNLYVVFSPRFDNLLNSNYVESVTEYRTVAYIAGEGSASSKPIIEAASQGLGARHGLRRREMFVDSSDSSRTITENGVTRHLTLEEYAMELANKAKEELNKHDKTRSFDGEVESSMTFRYGIDYFIGDLVEVENEYGMSGKSRVSELIRSYDSEGYREYPTFEKLEDEEEEL